MVQGQGSGGEWVLGGVERLRSWQPQLINLRSAGWLAALRKRISGIWYKLVFLSSITNIRGADSGYGSFYFILLNVNIIFGCATIFYHQ